MVSVSDHDHTRVHTHLTNYLVPNIQTTCVYIMNTSQVLFGVHTLCGHWVHGVGCLQEFLLEIQASPNVEYGELADILVRQAQSADEVTRMTALRWLRAFVSQAKDQLMPYYAIILAAVLPNVSHTNQDICQVQCAFWSGRHAHQLQTFSDLIVDCLL